MKIEQTRRLRQLADYELWRAKKEESVMITKVYSRPETISIAGVPIKELGKYIAQELAGILQPNEQILRHSINYILNGNATVELAIAEANRALSRDIYPKYEHGKGNKKVVVHIVMTGVGALIGGCIADASPVNNLLASVTDYCITNPNTVNSAVTTYMAPNVVYTEGHSIDNFFMNRIVLRPVKKLNQIGLIIDKGEDYDSIRKYVFQTAEMCRLAGGINLSNYVITDEHVGSRSFLSESGAITGEITNPGTLIRAMDKLLRNRAHEIDAFAVATQIQIPEGALDKYHLGEIPDPHGGVEAIISHMLSWRSGKMVAHGPLLSKDEIFGLLAREQFEARATGEIIGSIGYIGCVLEGLSRAPRIHFLNPNAKENLSPDWLKIADVAAVVVPWNSLGGLPMLIAAERGIPIIAVKDNHTFLNVTKETLGFGDSVIEVENYLEAVALVKRIVEGGTYRLSERERSKLMSEGYEIAEATGMSLESLVRPVTSFESFART